jgi:hypothetical protein
MKNNVGMFLTLTLPVYSMMGLLLLLTADIF